MANEKLTRTALAEECVRLILAGDENWVRVISPLFYQDAYAVMGLAFGMLANIAKAGGANA